MATVFSDDFNRANGSLGSNWTASNANTAIVSNEADIQSNSPPGFLTTTTSAHANIADCKVTITRRTGSGWDGGPTLRASSDGANGYYMDVYGTNNIDLYRRNSGGETLVTTRSVTHADNDTYGIEASGTGATVTLKLYRNGAQLGANISDSSGSRITTANRTGVYTWNNANQQFDDFVVDDLSAGSTAELSGTSSITFSTAGALTGTSALSGTTSVTFTPTANLTGQAALSGTSTLTFSPTGSLLAIATLAGTSNVVFTPTANLAGTSALSGTSSLSFSPSADLTGNLALSGISSLTFTTTGNLDAGTVPLSGTSSITFEASGNLVGVSDLSGTSGLTFDSTANLTGLASLSGSTAISFTTSADLQADAPGDLHGTTGIEFTASGNLTGTASLSGISSLSFSVSGDLTAVGADSEDTIDGQPSYQINEAYGSVIIYNRGDRRFFSISTL